jgi:serine/threonine protein kinase
VLGHGNFGKVFLGTSHHNKSQKYAIKLIEKKKGTQQDIDLIKQEI